MDFTEPFLQPPRWARALLMLALPCDPMRDAILGDLHEEFVGDASQHSVRLARVRYLRRTAGIVVRAMADAMIWRPWVSTAPVAATPQAVMKRSAPKGAVSAFAGFVVVALVVLVMGVVVNTLLFSASQARGTHGSAAAGAGGVALLVACVGIGALVMCAGPRWRRNRRRGA